VQESDYPMAGRFPAKTVERDFDRVVAIAQELAEEVDRAVKAPVDGSQSPEELLAGIFEARDTAVEMAGSAGRDADRSRDEADRAKRDVDAAVEDALGQLHAGFDETVQAARQAAEKAEREAVRAESEADRAGREADRSRNEADRAETWAKMAAGFPVGYLGLLPWRVDALPWGWYPATGLRYALDSHQGQALYGLPGSYKADLRITVTAVGGIMTINTPNVYHTDGRGMFLRPGTPVGSIEIDTMLPITGSAHQVRNQGIVDNASGAFSLGTRATGMNPDTAWGGHHLNLNSGLLGPRYSGTETAPIHVNVTPAVFLGV
jgi:hypothetical protein